MIKKLLAVISAICAVSFVSAYNPPAGGQNLLRISSPELLTDGTSSAGGAFYNVSPDSVVNNPAVIAYEQRIVLNASGTLLFDGKDESDESLGGAFEAGILYPSRWGVASALMEGVFVPYYDMHLGNSINMNGCFAKDVNDRLSVGMSLDLGIFYGYDSDWRGGINMGAFYNFGELAIFKDLRFGASLLNIGKPFSNTEVASIKDTYADNWPSTATPKMGAAGTLLNKKDFAVGATLDMALPGFQNLVIDAGVKLLIFNQITVSSSWEYDVKEFAEGHKNILPSVGVSFQFKFNSKDGSMLANKGWAQSEMTVSGAWKQMYENVNAVSAGAKLNLGLKDTQAPVIILWGDEE